MESLALSAFVWDDEVEFWRKELTSKSTWRCAVVVLRTREFPFSASLVDGSIWALRLACAAVDTVTGNVDRH
jgi:hypothetical protein